VHDPGLRLVRIWLHQVEFRALVFVPDQPAIAAFDADAIGGAVVVQVLKYAASWNYVGVSNVLRSDGEYVDGLGGDDLDLFCLVFGHAAVDECLDEFGASEDVVEDGEIGISR